jgi:hypothetical protein
MRMSIENMGKKKLTRKEERRIQELKEIIISIRKNPEAMKEVRKLAIAC